MRKPSSQIARTTNAEDEARLFAAELGTAPELDLHGLDTVSAEREADTFLHHHYMQRTPVIKIIHGRGTLILRDMLQRMLQKHPLVSSFRGSRNPHESDAVIYVALVQRPFITGLAKRR